MTNADQVVRALQEASRDERAATLLALDSMTALTHPRLGPLRRRRPVRRRR